MNMKPPMIRPPDLKPGDTVGILAPARKVSREEMKPAIDIINNWGYDVVEGKHLYDEQHQFSGSDLSRASDFQAMLDDDTIRAIFCARGGYGSVRIIDNIDFSTFIRHPKWIVGFSDITVFHAHIHSHWNIQTLHAAMPINFPGNRKPDSSLLSMKDILEGASPEYKFPAHALNRSGSASGQLIGGNLSILYSLCGSPSDIDTRGKILFIEDLDEYLYHIDRMMMNMKRSGKLEGLAGLIVGGMNEMNDNKVPYGQTAYEIIREAVSVYNFPVIFDFKSGHISENLGLIIGGHAHLQAAEQCSLSFND